MRTLTLYTWLLFAFCGAAALGADTATVTLDTTAHTVTIHIVVDSAALEAAAKASKQGDAKVGFWEQIRQRAVTALNTVVTGSQKTAAQVDAEAAALKAAIDAEAAKVKAAMVALPDPTK